MNYHGERNLRRGKLAARCWGSLESTYHTALVINIGVSTMMKKLFNHNNQVESGLGSFAANPFSDSKI